MLRATSRLSRTAAAARGRGLMQLGAAMSTSAPKFTGKLACLDLEGVLIPEVRPHAVTMQHYRRTRQHPIQHDARELLRRHLVTVV